MLRWEDITKTTQRLKVFGGWIVSRDIHWGHSWAGGASDSVGLSMVFIFDPFHLWRIGKNEPIK